VIEKHFTLSRADGGVDSAFSLEPAEMASLVIETERAWQSIGSIKYGPTEAEKKSLVFRRSIYLSADMKAGEILSTENIRCVRPGKGLAPKFFEEVIGRKINQDVSKGTPLSWDLIG
jgi:N-acetylneuraminate synthase